MKNFKTNLNINIDMAACIKAIAQLLLACYFMFKVPNEFLKELIFDFISFILKLTK